MTIVAEPVAPARQSGDGAGRCRIVSVAAVIENPLAKRYEDDLGRLFDIGAELGDDLVRRAVSSAGHRRVVAVGKAAVVGRLGELEHAAALAGSTFDHSVSHRIGEWQLVTPSTRQLAGPGAIVSVPLQPLLRQDPGPYPAIQIYLQNHPQPDEAVILLSVAVSIRG